MTKFKIICTIAIVALLSTQLEAKVRIYDVAKYGLKANSTKNASPIIGKVINRIKKECSPTDSVVLRFQKGTYSFHEKGSATREYYISNHDQVNPKKVGLALENINNLTLQGNGATLLFYGRMLPISLIESENCTLQDLSIDFAEPHIAQIQIVENSPTKGITFQPAPWVKWRIDKDSTFQTYGEGWSAKQSIGIAFEEKTKRLVYNTSDLYYSTKGAKALPNGTVIAPNWKDKKLIPGTVVAMRTWYRPAPGIFLANNKNTHLNNIQVHYAEGMGLLAQLCENIYLDNFSVCLKDDNDPRYFTTQADATHFSGCKGEIISKNGLYEGMMDDAINVHGTYLKVIKRVDNKTLIARYMHDQSWGFKWGDKNDSVQFVRSATMELVGKGNKIESIAPHDTKTNHGVREFTIRFQQPIDPAINESQGFGIENLTWTPKVLFANNTIRNNRARGSLFSTPQDVIVENNIFDHTSGSAILLCGDCNGWYETGACKKVTIRNNQFINALTNMFQFTNAVISIYPEIPNLKDQQKYFHGGKDGGIIIEENTFDTFDSPILYAKSVDGLIFRNNKINKNNQYKPLHWNKNRFLFERVTNVKIEE